MMMIILIITSSTLLIGSKFYKEIEKLFTSKSIVALLLMLNGSILILSKFVTTSKRKFIELSYFEAIIVGITQSIALMPGISRSGTVITTLLILGISKKSSGLYGFLISIPLILGAIIFKNPLKWGSLATL